MYHLAVQSAAERYLEMCLTYPQKGIARQVFREEVEQMISNVAEVYGIGYNKASQDVLSAFDELPDNPFANIGKEKSDAG